MCNVLHLGGHRWGLPRRFTNGCKPQVSTPDAETGGTYRPHFGANIEFHAKNSASQAAPKELIQAVATKYRAALLALGD